jgi:hypothetical protein
MRRSVPVFAAIFLFMASALFAALSRPIASYNLRARLNPDEKKVAGSEVLTWLNDSELPVSELRFHLYLNAFKNSRTTFMKESGGSSRGFKADKDNWGFMTVDRIRIQDGGDLTPSLAFLQPDDGNADDQTVMKVDLPAPLPPGEKIVVEIEFTSKLPKVFARSGFSGDFFMVGQWFPKIGVFQNGVWNCHQYHANSEFFADYGTYHVEITVPEKFVVGATGKRTGETKNADGTKTYVHDQEDVHDFAWTACPDFVEFREPYVLDEPSVRTEMILLVHRSHVKQKDRYAQALRNGLEFYSRSYGPYPYETITLVDPAPGAMGAGGMEYPTLFTAGTTVWMPRGVRFPEMVTIHEFGHGYWYGMVGSNEFEEAWLDEGINTYSEIKAMSKYYGEDRSMIDFAGLKIGSVAFNRMSVIGSGRFDPILKKSWEYISGGSYGLNVYAKAGLMLLTLEKWLGEEVMSRLMKTYFEQWKFRHPTSQDFIRVAEEVSGKDLGWFFSQVLHSPDRLDYAVSGLKAEEIAAGEGLFDVRTIEPPSKEPDAGRRPEGVLKAYRNEVTVARYGEWIFPQEILIVFDDGEKVRESWDGKDRWTRFVYQKTAKVVSAEIDPDHKMVLDANYANNSRVLELKRPAVVKAALGFMSWVQGFLSLISF